MKMTLKIKRFNPETDDKPEFREYKVEVAPSDRLLDALIQIKHFQDGTLGFRKSCAHGVCGSDAVRINGKDGLACKTLVQDVAEADGAVVEIEPMPTCRFNGTSSLTRRTFLPSSDRLSPF